MNLSSDGVEEEVATDGTASTALAACIPQLDGVGGGPKRRKMGDDGEYDEIGEDDDDEDQYDKGTCMFPHGERFVTRIRSPLALQMRASAAVPC